MLPSEHLQTLLLGRFFICMWRGQTQLPSCFSEAVPRGATALLAGLVLGVDPWGNFYWNGGDVMCGITAAAPLGVLCEHMC